MCSDAVTVSADVKDIELQSPDPGTKVFVSEELLDANPGRPGAPIAIPAYPHETASSSAAGFAPGVAGDHGEPIAPYILAGSYLTPNNVSANTTEAG